MNALVGGGEIHGWHAGPLHGVIEALAPRARELFGRHIDGPSPFVVCFIDHPLDRDFYQALKGFEHWKSAVAAGGILALVADCPAGIGPPTFTQFLGSTPTLASIEQRAREDYRLGDHKLMNFLRFTASGRRVWLVSPSLSGRNGLPLPIFDSVENAIRAATDIPSPSARRALLIENAAALISFPS